MSQQYPHHLGPAPTPQLQDVPPANRDKWRRTESEMIFFMQQQMKTAYFVNKEISKVKAGMYVIALTPLRRIILKCEGKLCFPKTFGCFLYYFWWDKVFRMHITGTVSTFSLFSTDYLLIPGKRLLWRLFFISLTLETASAQEELTTGETRDNFILRLSWQEK